MNNIIKSCPQCIDKESNFVAAVEKSAEYFHRGKNGGLSSWCKFHTQVKDRERYRNNPPDKEAVRNRHYQRTYGMTASEYDQVVELAGGVCAICQQPPRELTRSGNPAPLEVHHDHESFELVAVLCGSCNRAVGLLKDDPELLRRAALVQELKPIQQQLRAVRGEVR